MSGTEDDGFVEPHEEETTETAGADTGGDGERLDEGPDGGGGTQPASNPQDAELHSQDLANEQDIEAALAATRAKLARLEGYKRRREEGVEPAPKRLAPRERNDTPSIQDTIHQFLASAVKDASLSAAAEREEATLPPSEYEQSVTKFYGITQVGVGLAPETGGDTPEYADALRRRVIHLKNLAQVKRDLSLARGCPTIAPKELDNVVHLRYVDFDKVHPSIRLAIGQRKFELSITKTKLSRNDFMCYYPNSCTVQYIT
ncbi:uncharacterized protein EV422DRAFT_9796 [Fimicolochytrium jonesii]|uniref:uncharacterized protein n=1 Tax=Fimicolochytrium jonesii TaxID=1396493 RepID=UPI0022FF39AC|nr:uncharacterized protein EV422DRAFT_9796 [Fimicolochytrium jonesii]KAI8826765.1 hypothetical protein EV422DRAFT_9796 [Fimicolochytrium jonesii]